MSALDLDRWARGGGAGESVLRAGRIDSEPRRLTQAVSVDGSAMAGRARVGQTVVNRRPCRSSTVKARVGRSDQASARPGREGGGRREAATSKGREGRGRRGRHRRSRVIRRPICGTDALAAAFKLPVGAIRQVSRPTTGRSFSRCSKVRRPSGRSDASVTAEPTSAAASAYGGESGHESCSIAKRLARPFHNRHHEGTITRSVISKTETA